MKNASDSKTIVTDHLVVGSGIAGMMLAIKLSRFSKVMVVSKDSLIDNNTYRAQGGIASVLDGDDSFANHLADTQRAGAGLCHTDVVEMVVQSGPSAIEELISLGVDFTPAPKQDQLSSKYHLTKEGGHSKRRVIHAKDLTGREVLNVLIRHGQQIDNISLFEDQYVIDLLTSDKLSPEFSQNSCLGAYILNRETGGIYQVRAKATFLCTGGHGRCYLYTSNYDGATGDGIAMGARAGCKVANLEFMQFHPTCLFHPKAKNFLITEALRGEGAVLKNHSGVAFMDKIHPSGSLAPRDIVAQAIDAQLKSSGKTHVYLDASGIGALKLKDLFPNIYRKCLECGIDITRDSIPVVPAAHYSCGGLAVDIWGRTNVQNLFAIGEAACTGLHGANRLASNSLLEALVFADRVSKYVAEHTPTSDLSIQIPHWNPADAAPPDELVVLTHTWDEIRRLMWNYVGIVRTTKRLERALQRTQLIREELNRYYWDYQVMGSFLEVRNLADVAYLTIRSALSRKESRGIHYNLDYPHKSSYGPKDSILHY